MISTIGGPPAREDDADATSVHVLPDSLIASHARLSSLDDHEILDTPPEPGFDAIVRLATRLCATPVGLVSLVDHDRQWFKARVNFPHCETDLDRSVCKFVLAEPDLLVIDDLVADPRTSANPLVTGEPFIRFYAGAPLCMPDGQVLGSLCVIDTVPRPGGLTPEQVDDLRALAGQVVDQLRMRQAIAGRDRLLAQQGDELRRARRLDVLAKASAALVTSVDPAATLAPLLAEAGETLGFDRAMFYDVALDGRHLRLVHAVNLLPEVQAQIAHVPFGTHPCGMIAASRRPLMLADLQSSTDPAHDAPRSFGVNSYAGYPIMSRGELCGVMAFVSTLDASFDAETVAFFETLTGLVAAVHERLDGEEALAEVGAYWHSLFERLSEGFVVGEMVYDHEGRATDWRYVEVNHAWGGLMGIEARSVVGRTVREVIPGVEDEWIDEFARVVGTGEPATFLRRVGTLDRWYEGRAFSVGRDRFAALFLEVTDRIHAEARRAAQLALGDRLSELTSVPEMTRAASEIVGRTLGVTRAGFGRVDADIANVDIEPDWTAPGISSIAGHHRFADFGDIRRDLRSGKALVIHDVRTDPRTRDDPAPMLDLGIGALVNVPVRDRGRTVAVFIVQDDKPRAWTAETLIFLQNVADRLEAGVARLRAEEDQRVLNGEIAHRLKNTFAMVMSIASQTLRGVPDRAPVQSFEQRILALSAAHNVLLKRTWTAASMRDVIEAVLEAAGHGDRVVASGPEVALGPRATLTTSLLLHELVTNAVKYGSLSTPGGKVTARWRLEGDGEHRELVLDWTERGGPPPVAPAQSKRAGFGSRLIRMGLAGSGGVDLRYPPSGFEATMRAPLVQLQGE